MKKYGYIWVTLFLFVISLTGHWVLAWYAYVEEQKDKGATPEFPEFVVETSRDTLENWQSEFLQLIWQVAGLSFLYCVGSPQSKEGDDRREEKLNALLRAVDPKHAEELIRKLDKKYSEEVIGKG